MARPRASRPRCAVMRKVLRDPDRIPRPLSVSVARCQEIDNIRDMPFEFKTVLEHGTSNPIVARLSLQTLEILDNCNASKDIQEKVRELYMNSLPKKLLHCWEIEQRFK